MLQESDFIFFFSSQKNSNTLLSIKLNQVLTGAGNFGMGPTKFRLLFFVIKAKKKKGKVYAVRFV